MSTKLWSSFLCWNCIGGAACHQPPQFWIADSVGKKGVQNLGLVQKCTNWVKIMIQFLMLKLHLWWCTSPTLFGSECRTRTSIAIPVMVEFLRPDVSELGGCWSRWWTSLPDSCSSPCSSIPVVYQARFVLLRRRIFFLPARIAAIRYFHPVRPEFQFRSSIAYFLCARVNYTREKRNKYFLVRFAWFFRFIFDLRVHAIVLLDAQATSRHIARLTVIYFAWFFLSETSNIVNVE